MTPEELDAAPPQPEHMVELSRLVLTKTDEFMVFERRVEERWKGVDLAVHHYSQLSKLYKRYIRFGIPDVLRPRLWPVLSRSAEMQHQISSLYRVALRSAFGHRVPEEILSPPMFNGNFRVDVHCLNPAGVRCLHRLMTLIRLQNPEVDFCPVLPDIAGLCMLFLSEKRTFFMLQMMLDRSTGSGWYFPTTRLEFKSFFETFASLVSRVLRPIGRHLEVINCPVELFADTWFSHFFVHTLPMPIVLAIFDSFLNEGSKIMYRVGLALLKKYKKDILECTDAASLILRLRELGRQETNVDDLMRIHLSRSTYGKILARHRDRLGQVMKFPSKDVYYRPKVHGTSSIITDLELEALWEVLPTRFRIMDAELVFNTAKDGYSQGTLFKRVRMTGPLLTIIRSTKKEVFGCFTTESWKDRSEEKYYGTRECFVFRFAPELQFFKWRPPISPDQATNDCFMLSGSRGMSIGGGGKGAAIWIDAQLDRGMSNASVTFNNEPLVADIDFRVQAMEAFALSDEIDFSAQDDSDSDSDVDDASTIIANT